MAFSNPDNGNLHLYLKLRETLQKVGKIKKERFPYSLLLSSLFDSEKEKEMRRRATRIGEETEEEDEGDGEGEEEEMEEEEEMWEWRTCNRIKQSVEQQIRHELFICLDSDPVAEDHIEEEEKQKDNDENEEDDEKKEEVDEKSELQKRDCLREAVLGFAKKSKETIAEAIEMIHKDKESARVKKEEGGATEGRSEDVNDMESIINRLSYYLSAFEALAEIFAKRVQGSVEEEEGLSEKERYLRKLSQAMDAFVDLVNNEGPLIEVAQCDKYIQWLLLRLGFLEKVGTTDMKGWITRRCCPKQVKETLSQMKIDIQTMQSDIISQEEEYERIDSLLREGLIASLFECAAGLGIIDLDKLIEEEASEGADLDKLIEEQARERASEKKGRKGEKEEEKKREQKKEDEVVEKKKDEKVAAVETMVGGKREEKVEERADELGDVVRTNEEGDREPKGKEEEGEEEMTEEDWEFLDNTDLTGFQWIVISSIFLDRLRKLLEHLDEAALALHSWKLDYCCMYLDFCLTKLMSCAQRRAWVSNHESYLTIFEKVWHNMQQQEEKADGTLGDEEDESDNPLFNIVLDKIAEWIMTPPFCGDHGDGHDDGEEAKEEEEEQLGSEGEQDDIRRLADELLLLSMQTEQYIDDGPSIVETAVGRKETEEDH